MPAACRIEKKELKNVCRINNKSTLLSLIFYTKKIKKTDPSNPFTPFIYTPTPIFTFAFTNITPTFNLITMQKGIYVALLVLSALCGYLIFRTWQLENKITSLSSSETLSPANGAPLNTDSPRSPFDQPSTDPEGDAFANQTTALSPPAAAPTSIAFEQTTHDFGRKTNDKPLKTRFIFRNSGPNPLIISQAIGSCGCTVPQWPKEPVTPGASGEIFVEFDPKGKTGETTKTISVSANTNPTVTTLSVKATLVPKID